MARPTYPSDNVDKTLLRFPDGLRDRLRAEAEKNHRSLNSEIIARLEASFTPSPAPASGDPVEILDNAVESIQKLRSIVEGSMHAKSKATASMRGEAVKPDGAVE